MYEEYNLDRHGELLRAFLLANKKARETYRSLALYEQQTGVAPKLNETIKEKRDRMILTGQINVLSDEEVSEIHSRGQIDWS